MSTSATQRGHNYCRSWMFSLHWCARVCLSGLQTTQKPKTHIVFDSSPESDERRQEQDVEEGDDGANDGDSEGGDEDGRSTRAFRSSYVGRGNVQAVRAARKLAGLSDGFPRSDPLLVEFDNFMRASGAAEKDITNKVDSDTRTSVNWFDNT